MTLNTLPSHAVLLAISICLIVALTICCCYLRSGNNVSLIIAECFCMSESIRGSLGGMSENIFCFSSRSDAGES